MSRLLIGAAMMASWIAASPAFAIADPPESTYSRPKPPKRPPGVSQQGTDPDGQACTPAGYNAGTSSYPTCVAGNASPASAANPPRCSKTVTDHCVQAYERGVRR